MAKIPALSPSLGTSNVMDHHTWLTPKDVASRLDVAPSTVLRMVDNGLLRARNLSSGRQMRRLRIDPMSIADLLNRPASRLA